jgi:hypothetical protein
MGIIVWGIAEGIRDTKDAAVGAFTVREYKNKSEIIPGSWRIIIAIEEK